MPHEEPNIKGNAMALLADEARNCPHELITDFLRQRLGIVRAEDHKGFARCRDKSMHGPTAMGCRIYTLRCDSRQESKDPDKQARPDQLGSDEIRKKSLPPHGMN